jgi:hypothetical protein
LPPDAEDSRHSNGLRLISGKCRGSSPERKLSQTEPAAAQREPAPRRSDLDDRDMILVITLP